MVAFSPTYESREDQWWAFSQSQGWVVLDRTKVHNQVTEMPEQLEFVRCRDWEAYRQDEQAWDYREAGRYLAGLAWDDAIAARRELTLLQKQFNGVNN